MIASTDAAPQKVTLYTSLPPKTKRVAAGREVGGSYQRECIASWRRYGFDVVSLNPRAEIEALLPLGYDISFKEVASARPRISDFLAAIQEEPAAVAGIVNADCLLIANDAAMSLVLQSAKQGLVLIERMNIRAEDLNPTGVSCFGFDLFLFSKKVLGELVFDQDITIGTPWWDYWFPIAYRLAGGELFSAPAPLMMHLDHPQSWSYESWLAYGRKMHHALAKNRNSLGALPFARHSRTNELSDSEVGDLATAAFQWLKTSPSSLDMEDMTAWLWCSILAGIDTLPKQVNDARHEAAEVERLLKSSLSWKVTRPLRGIERMLSRIKLPTRLSSVRLFSNIWRETRVPASHPLRKVRKLVREVLHDFSGSFGKLYASEGRPSVPSDQLLSALLIQVFYGIRSERQLIEQLDYNLLYRWFVGLSPDDRVWDLTNFTKSRDLLEKSDAFQKFMTKLLNHPEVQPLLSNEHFSVDGTLIEAWASPKGLYRDDGDDKDDGKNFPGQKRTNDTPASNFDPQIHLYRKAAGR